MRTTPGVNITNILRAAFSYESFLRSFYVLKIWVCNFWRNDFGAKAAHKMLVKLTPGNSLIHEDETASFGRHQTGYGGHA